MHVSLPQTLETFQHDSGYSNYPLDHRRKGSCLEMQLFQNKRVENDRRHKRKGFVFLKVIFPVRVKISFDRGL